VKKWNAKFKVTTTRKTERVTGTRVTEGIAVFENASTPSLTMVSVSGEFTVTESDTITGPDVNCKLEETRGSGVIGPGDGRLFFAPDNAGLPTQVQYYGSGTSATTITTTYSVCSNGTPPPITFTSSEGWLSIPLELQSRLGFFTSPSLISFQDQYVVTSADASSTTTFEWSFTRAN
jgi:hypothetical protein